MDRQAALESIYKKQKALVEYCELLKKENKELKERLIAKDLILGLRMKEIETLYKLTGI